MHDPNKRKGVPVWTDLDIKVQLGSLRFDFFFNENIHSLPIPRAEKHNHSAIELQFFEEGSGKLLVENREHELLDRTIHVIGQYIYHSSYPDSRTPGKRATLRFAFHEAESMGDHFPSEELDQMKTRLSDITYLQLSDPLQTALFFQILAHLRTEIMTPAIGSYTKITSLCAELLVELVRCMDGEIEKPCTYTLPYRDKNDQWDIPIDSFFTNYKENLTLDMLAQSLHLSTRQTNRLLKKHFNASFKQKLQETRIEAAKDLLRTSRHSLEYIADHVGYTSTQYFCQLFFRMTGLTPAEYRRVQPSSSTR